MEQEIQTDESGQGVTLEDVEKGERVEWKEIHNTAHKHYWIESASQDPNSDMLSIQCKDCWSGASIDPAKVKIEDGEMVAI